MINLENNIKENTKENTMEEKICSICNEKKELNEFPSYKFKDTRHIFSYCRKCSHIKKNAYAKKIRDLNEYRSFEKVFKPCIGIICRSEVYKWLLKGTFICQDCRVESRKIDDTYQEQHYTPSRTSRNG